MILIPVFVSGIGVGPVFKGLKQFDTAAIEFDFQTLSLSYHFIQASSQCLKSGSSNFFKDFLSCVQLIFLTTSIVSASIMAWLFP